MSIDEIKSMPSETPAASDAGLDHGETQTPPQASKDSQPKGFADIVEYHRRGAGRDIQIVPTEEWAPNTNKTEDENKTTQYNDYAIVLRRVWIRSKKDLSLSKLELEIRSETLCKAFREIAVDCYQGTDLLSTPIKLTSPFRELFFYRDQIKALVEDQTVTPKLRQEAGWLHEFIQTNGLMKSIIHDYEEYTKLGRIPTEILWTVFPPNGLVVASANKISECWICRNISINLLPGGYVWVVMGFRVGFDGDKPGLVRRIYALSPHTKNMTQVEDLPVVPIEYCQDLAAKKEAFLARSATLRRILGQTFTSFASQVYNGPSWPRDFFLFSAFENATSTSKKTDERVMVDCTAFLKHAAMPPIRLESLHERPKSSVRKAAGKPRGIIIGNGPYIPPPPAPGLGFAHPPGVPHGSVPRGSVPHGSVPGGPRGQPIWHAAPMPSGPVNSDSVLSDSDSSDSDWSEIDADGFDPAGNAGIMEFRTFGNSAEPNELPEPDGDNLESLAKTVNKLFHVSAEDFNLLFPSMVPAFGLKEKEWRWVLSDLLQDVKWNTAAFESLQLEGGTKDLIQSLVKGYRSRASFDDVVPGKGQGLIFLLHGKPGLGKTLTAESVADHLERPMYAIQAGELSTDAGLLEKKLNEISYLTRRWDAVSLLDEADVLLCKRKSSEMDRNAVVAVFLRKIEYFQGVLFLTTNRREDFDDAFKSRIHLTISYPDLSEAAQSNIWKKLIATNQDIEVDDSWVDAAFENLGKLGLNGRTIRNFLRTAVSYADARGELLGIRHVLEIIRTELKGDGLDVVFSLTPNEHQKRALAGEALRHLERLAG